MLQHFYSWNVPAKCVKANSFIRGQHRPISIARETFPGKVSKTGTVTHQFQHVCHLSYLLRLISDSGIPARIAWRSELAFHRASMSFGFRLPSEALHLGWYLDRILGQQELNLQDRICGNLGQKRSSYWIKQRKKLPPIFLGSSCAKNFFLASPYGVYTLFGSGGRITFWCLLLVARFAFRFRCGLGSLALLHRDRFLS